MIENVLERIKNLELNFLQSIAVTGLLFSLAAQLGLYVIDKHIDRFWAVYIVWLLVLTLSSFIKGGNGEHHHH